ncbi:Histone H2A.Z [Diplonema papillatum]|nr:Histone H2A.Z [Diplonema papillatum]
MSSTLGKMAKVGSGKYGAGVGKDRGKTTQSSRANVQFPVGRVHRMMKGGLVHGRRVSATGAVYLTAVLEYLCAEILELAGFVAKSRHGLRITPRYLMFAIRGDQELDKFIKATIASGGIVPHRGKDELLAKGKPAKVPPKKKK